MKFKHFIFDLDGTIVETKEIHQQAFNDALEYLAYDKISPEDLHEYEALPSFEKIRKYNEKHGFNIDVDEFLAVKNRFSQILLSSHNFRNIEVIRIFQDLKISGKYISLCSNCSLSSIYIILENMGIKHLIDKIYHNKSCAPKPNPEMFDLAIADSFIPAKETVIFEDSEKGVTAALLSNPDATVIRVPNSLSFIKTLSR